MFHDKTRRTQPENLLFKELNATKIIPPKGSERGEAGAGGESVARLAQAESRRELGDLFLLLFLIWF